MKKCPFCAEEIQDEAKKCRYCASDLTIQQSKTPNNLPTYSAPKLLHKKFIIPGEDIYFELKPARFNWYWFPVLLCILSIFSPGLFLISLPILIIVDAAHKGRIYAITTKRIILAKGILNKQLKECPLSKIQNIDLKIPWGSLNTGTIAFDTAGTPFKEISWEIVKNPQDVYQKISTIIHK